VFSNELLQSPLLRTLRRAYSPSSEPAPLVADPPLIFSRLSKFLGLNVVPHRKACIVLAVYESGDCRNRSFGNNLGDENNSSSIIAALFATNIEA
jgi:hypothetical protein